MTRPLQIHRPPEDPSVPTSPADATFEPTADLKTVQTFFSLEGLEAGLGAGGTLFTQTRLVELMVRLCEDPDPKVQLAAIARLTAYIETCLKLNGRIATLTQKEKSPHGNDPAASVTRTARTTTTLTAPVPAAPRDISLPEGATTVVEARS